MCGIVCHYHPTKNINVDVLLDHYLTQRNRGHDGFGFSYMDAEGKLVTKRYEYEAEAFYDLSKVESKMILLHHRFPTSTKNEARFNQPIERESKKMHYALAHNGVISNARELQREEFKDYTFTSQGDSSFIFNDSETLLHSITDVIERKRKTVLASGSIAFVMIKANEEGKITRVFFGRNNNPLYYLQMTDGTVGICSTWEGSKSTMIDADFLFSFPVYGKEAYIASKKRLEFRSHTPYVAPSKPLAPATPPLIGTGSRTPDFLKNTDKKDAEGDWEKDGDTNSWIRKPKPTRILEGKVLLNAEYMEALAIAKTLIDDLDVMGIDGISNNEKRQALREIDDMVKILNGATHAAYQRETTKVEKLKEELYQRRLDYLPVMQDVEQIQSMSILDRVSSFWNGDER